MLLWNILVFLFGLLLLAGSAATLLDQWNRQAKGHVVLGEVIDIQGDHAGEYPSYTFTVKFLTHTGKVGRWKDTSSRSDSYALGEKVPLVSHPRHEDLVVPLQSLNPLGLPLRVAGWGVILVAIGGCLLIASFLLHTSVDTLSLVERTLWTAGMVAVTQGLARALLQFRLLTNGVEVAAVISPGGGGGLIGPRQRGRGFVQFVTRNGETSYYSIPSPYVGMPGEKLSVLYDPMTPTRAMSKTLVRPLRQFFIKGGEGSLLCLTAALLVLFQGAPLSQALLGAFLCLAGLWIVFRLGIIAFIDNWRAATAQLPAPILPALLVDIAEDEGADHRALPERAHQSRSAVSPVQQQSTARQSLSTLYPLANLIRFLRPALLKSRRRLLVTGALGAFLLIIGTLVGRNMLSWWLLLEIGATMTLLVMVGAFGVREITH